MSYPVREYVEGYWYHVYSRGQRGEPLFFSPDDRESYIKRIDTELKRRGGAIGSFCLMTNHCHLLLRMGSVSLGDILRNAHSDYARGFNQKRKLDGHVTQKRPGVKIVLDTSYLFTLVGYIHRNPVEANIRRQVTDYRWSSWYWFEQKPCDWCDLSSWEYPPGFKGEQGRKRFRLAVDRGDHEWPGGQSYIGTQSEWDQFEERRQGGRPAQAYRDRRGQKEKVEIAKELVVGRSFGIDELKGPSRARDISEVRHQAMALMYEEGYGTSEIARWFNRTPAAVSQAHEKWRSSD